MGKINNESRRGFLKKAAYTAPAMMALGALAPTVLNANTNSAVFGLKQNIIDNKKQVLGYQEEIIKLQAQKSSATRAEKKAINDQIQYYKDLISGERTDNLDLRNQIKVIKG